MTFLDWLTKYEAVAVWLEGIALVAIFIWDRVDANHDHTETLAQLGIAQAQIKISQNAERAWVLTELNWSGYQQLKVVENTSGGNPGDGIIETTTVAVKLTCRNEGRSPAWVDKVEGYGEIVEQRLRDIPSFVGHKMDSHLPIGPIGPGKEETRIMLFVCPGHAKGFRLISLFLLVEYRDIFDQKRTTTCGYTVSGDILERQDQFPDRNRNT
jgi:hypothetical protein